MRLPDTLPADLVVLVAEDDAFARNLIRKMLETIGVGTILMAGDGAEALAIFSAGMTRIDAILSDIHMPKCNGFELFDAIHAIDPDVPFLLVTGDSREKAVAEARARAISAYVVKPLSPAQLREKLVATLQRDPAYPNRVWPRTIEGLAFQREASERQRAVFDIWRVGADGGKLPEPAMLDRWGVTREAPFDRVTFVVDVERPGPRLRYVHVGADLRARFPRDPTGQCIDEMPFLHRRYAMPAYERILNARIPHFRTVKGIEGFLLLRYRRLMLPFAQDGEVRKILGCVELL
ncbi:MAG: response regulator [Rhodospirillales bacterium]|nr:response regulator [Rhodospirillales bacterium]